MKRQQGSDQNDCRIVEDILHGLRELEDSQIKKKKKGSKDLKRMFKMGVSVRKLKLPRGAGKIGLNLNSLDRKTNFTVVR